MYRVALKMLFGDVTKYLGLVFGVAFSTLLINQQSGICVGLLARGGNLIQDISEADIWVMDPGVKTVDQVFPLRDTELGRVRGTPGVAWATPFFTAVGSIRTASGELENATILGIDDTTLVGLPPKFILGSPEDLKRPDAVAMAKDSYPRIWPNEPLELGKTFELNDRRAIVVAIVESSPTFTSANTIYTRYSQALRYTNNGRNQLSYILVRSVDGQESQTVANTIHERTGLQALTAAEFRWKSIQFIIDNTGIPFSFGVVIALGIVVGVAIVGLLFNLFVLENLRQYAALKAIGVKNHKLVRMVLLQAFVVGFVGYAFGLGMAASFFEFVAKAEADFKGFFLPWQVAFGSAVVVAGIMVVSTVFSLRKVLFVDPAIVFRG